MLCLFLGLVTVLKCPSFRFIKDCLILTKYIFKCFASLASLALSEKYLYAFHNGVSDFSTMRKKCNEYIQTVEGLSLQLTNYN